MKSNLKAKLSHCILTIIYCGLNTHRCVGKLSEQWFSQWLVAYGATRQFMEQCLPLRKTSVTFESKWKHIHWSKCIWKWRPWNMGQLILVLEAVKNRIHVSCCNIVYPTAQMQISAAFISSMPNRLEVSLSQGYCRASCKITKVRPTEKYVADDIWDSDVFRKDIVYYNSSQGLILLSEINETRYRIRAWINDYRTFETVRSHPCPVLNGSLLKPLSGHWWVIASHMKWWIL